VIVRLEIGKNQWRPGETLEGTVSWELTGAPGAVEVRLSWETQGKGTQDTKIVQRVRFDNPALSDRKPFRIELPEGPYSFSGKLVSLAWSVEAVGESGGKSGRVELTISPTGSEILLHRK
jgi:hypothetical protein